MRIDRAANGSEAVPLGSIFGVVLLLAAGMGAAWVALGLPLPACAFHAWTGLPCPTCGTTRMVDAALHGEVGAAFTWNPLVFLGLTAVAVWAIVSTLRYLIGLPPLRIVVERWERASLRVGAIATLLTGWAYLVWRGV